MKRERKTAQLGLRIQPSLRNALQEWAIAEHRSLTSLIEKVMADAATAAGYPPGGEKPSAKRRPRPEEPAKPKVRASTGDPAEQAAA